MNSTFCKCNFFSLIALIALITFSLSATPRSFKSNRSKSLKKQSSRTCRNKRPSAMSLSRFPQNSSCDDSTDNKKNCRIKAHNRIVELKKFLKHCVTDRNQLPRIFYAPNNPKLTNINKSTSTQPTAVTITDETKSTTLLEPQNNTPKPGGKGPFKKNYKNAKNHSLDVSDVAEKEKTTPKDVNDFVEKRLNTPSNAKIKITPKNQRRFTDKSIVLIHGLNGSPESMNDLALFYKEQGYNVVTVLLSGHGNKPGDLSDVSYQHWKKDVAQAVEIAKKLGRDVEIAGHSTGGALAKNYIKNNPNQISKLHCFDCPYDVKGFKSNLATFLYCNEEDLEVRKKKFADQYKAGAGIKDDAFLNRQIKSCNKKSIPFFYNRLNINAVCQVQALLKENQENKNPINIPTYLTVTNGKESKTLAMEEGAIETKEKLGGKAKVVPLEGVEHSLITLAKCNPEFKNMLTQLDVFVNSSPNVEIIDKSIPYSPNRHSAK